jgi:NAD(P)-dependent dehydrogenase (short-subunit alcohol dehydrogenase family)
MKANDIFNLEGRAAVVVGGASGIGLGIARALIDNGARVTIADVDEAATERALTELGSSARGDRLDVTDRAAADRLFDVVDAEYGGIDILFANAGIGGGGGCRFPQPGGENPDGVIDKSPDGEWEEVIAVNLTGMRNVCAAGARVMKARGRGGRIVLTSSVAAIRTVPFVSTAYHAAKAGVSHLGRMLALELAPHSIMVNIVSPANFHTNIGDGAMADPAVQAVFARSSLLQRLAQPDEIAGLALLLASDASAFITGVEIPIDGGACLVGPA